MRTIVDLPEHQIAALSALCEQEHISRTEAVRRAIDAYLARQQATPGTGFGSGEKAGTTVDGLAYERELRGEWDR